MTGGFMGKILRVNLSTGSFSTINTSDYEEWGGGHGIGSAIFWDLCADKLPFDGFDPQNVITLMTSPLSGTIAPSVAGRTEIQGVGTYPYPIGWFTRSNFGGRFAGELKYAGWDGIVLEGESSTPVWLNIINEKVTLEDASGLWGMDTWATQEEIWSLVSDISRYGEWRGVDATTFTTQRPAVLAIGPAGENLARNAALVHGAGNGAGQGGFGGIFGKKNIKAISVLGSSSIEVADPAELVAARTWFDGQHAGNLLNRLGVPTGPSATSRGSGCIGCPTPCRNRRKNGIMNDSQCFEAAWYSAGGYSQPADPLEKGKAVDLLQRYGVNCCDVFYQGGPYQGQLYWLSKLYEMGILGIGKEIDSSPLHFDEYGTLEFARAFLKAVSYRQGIGNDLAEGACRAAEKWGRVEEDLDSGLLHFPHWGYVWHHTLPTIDWTWGGIMGDRDINEHDFSHTNFNRFSTALMEPDEMVATMSERMFPYEGDPHIFDFGEEGKYSVSMAKLTSWHRYYTRFYKQSLGYCDWGSYCSIINRNNPAGEAEKWKGTTPEAEPRFFNAITGNNISFVDGMKIGQKIWNLDRAVWILQGRHRDMEVSSGFMFKPGAAIAGYNLPVYENGEWSIKSTEFAETYLDRIEYEKFKTRYYELEGWDTSSGWPKRSTLEGLGLKNVADLLETRGKLGA